MIEITENGSKLRKVNIPRTPPYIRNDPHYFSDPSDVREAVEKVFESEAKYTLFQTVGNSEVDELLRNSEEEIKEKGYKQCQEIRLRADIRDMFIFSIHKNLEHTVIFPLVRTNGVHSLNKHPEEYKWPIIHVVKGDTDSFLNAIKNQLDGANYNRIRQKEAPHNYSMPIYDTIFFNRIAPILLEERTWVTQGENLKDAIDFLVQYEYKKERTEVFHDD